MIGWNRSLKNKLSEGSLMACIWSKRSAARLYQKDVNLLIYDQIGQQLAGEKVEDDTH
jgi:hypothetical protein